jgi:hypothetical protein
MTTGVASRGKIDAMPKLTVRVFLPLTAALVAILAASPVLAVPRPAKKAAADPHEAFYRCKNEKGQSFVGQSIPAECMETDVDVLDSSGRKVRTIPGRRSQDQVAQQKAAADAAAAAAQRDRTLLATYLTVSDIERLRDQRVEQLEQQALVTRSYIANLRARQARLMEDVQRYRPYSDRPKAPALPEPVAAEIINTVNGLQIYEQELVKNMAEQQRLRSAFDSDIARFRELKSFH